MAATLRALGSLSARVAERATTYRRPAILPIRGKRHPSAEGRAARTPRLAVPGALLGLSAACTTPYCVEKGCGAA